MITVKHHLKRYYTRRVLYDDKLFTAEKEIVKQSDFYIFGTACQILERYNSYKILANSKSSVHLKISMDDLVRTLSFACVTASNIYEKYVELISKIDSSAGVKSDNITNREIFDERLESLEKLQAVSGYDNIYDFGLNSVPNLRNFAQDVETFSGMKKLLGIFDDGIAEICKSMHRMTLPKYREDEMFPKGKTKGQSQKSSEKSPKASK